MNDVPPARSTRRRFVVVSAAAGLSIVLGRAVPVATGQTRPMPPGHPPAGPGSPPPGPPDGSGTGKTALTWAPPASWVAEKPSSSMRRAQYRIQGKGGAAECVVFYFGPGDGGDARANVERWGSQFRRPDGKPVGDAMKTRDMKVGDVKVVMVEVTGTYVGGMGGQPSTGERPDHMLLGAIAQGPDANWFFRATGPRATLEGARADFEKMIRSIKRGS